MAAERLGHHLMAEADADQLRATFGRAQEGLERPDPRQIVVDAGLRPGDQIGVMVRRPSRQLARRDVVDVEGDIVAEQRREQVGKPPEPRREVAGRRAGLEDAEPQLSPFAVAAARAACS
jgi:hypothetical protein